AYVYRHSRARGPNAEIDWQRADLPPSTVEFELFDSESQPIPGVRVEVDSYSGWQEAVCTDARGRARIEAGGPEIHAINLNGVEAFRDESVAAQLVGPSLGMRIRVVVKNHRAFGIAEGARSEAGIKRR